jgi:hypothetical protein
MINQKLAAQLLEKWNPVLEATSPIDSEETRLDTAVVLENTERHLGGARCINEAEAPAYGNVYGGMGVRDIGVQGYNKNNDPTSGVLGQNSGYGSPYDGQNNNVLPTLIIPMVRRIFPELMAHDTVSVQPMTGPVGFAFAFRSLYGAKGQIDMGFETPTAAYNGTNENELGYNNMYAQFTGASAEADYGTADNASTAWAAYTGSNKNLYGTGRDTAGAEWAGVGFQSDPAYPQVGFDWLRATVEAKTRKLGAHWSLDVQEDANAMQGIDISEEMMSTIGFELAAEIDRQLLSSQVLAAIKGGKIASWSPASADGYDQKGRLITLFTEINYLSNTIAENTRRGSANFAIASTKATSLIQTVNAEAFFAANTNGKIPSLPNTGVGSLLKVGLMNGGSQLLIRDTFARGDYMLLGYKGSQKGDTGIVFCPYIPVQMMKATDPRTFAPILGARTRYGVLDNVWGSGNYYYFLMLKDLTGNVPGINSDGKRFAFWGVQGTRS